MGLKERLLAAEVMSLRLSLLHAGALTGQAAGLRKVAASPLSPPQIGLAWDA